MHGSTKMPELHLYVRHGYFNAFCTRVCKVFGDKVHYAFSSAFSMEPNTVTETGNHEDGDEFHPWYKPLTAAKCPNKPGSPMDFELGGSIWYNDGKGNRSMAVYEGADASGTLHTVRLQDGSRLNVNQAHIQLLEQPDFSNIPKTPLDYRNEVGTGLSLEEAQALATPQVLSPLQQEFMSWHHCLYHLPYHMIFCLAKLGILPKRLLECRNKPPLCVSCQFGQAHRRP